MTLLIRNAVLNGKQINLQVEEGTITAIGTEAANSSDQVLEAKGRIILPSMVNAHTHAAMTLLRSYADDLPLHEWLNQKIWPHEAHLTEKDVYIGTKLACLEMLKNGITAFADMYFHAPAIAKAVQETGIRACISEVFFDAVEKEEPGKVLRALPGRLEELKKASPLILPAVGPHAVYTVNKEHLTKIAEIAKEQGAFTHIHLSETEKEVDDCLKEHNKRPAALMHETGLLGEKTLCAHGVFLDEKEIKLLADTHTTVAHCPHANMKLTVGGVLPYPALKQAGVRVTLGTDGPASNNALDILSEAKTAALLQKHARNDPTVMPASEAWEMASKAGWDFLGINAGEIKEGAAADFILLDKHHPALYPGHHLTADLIYTLSGGAVDTVVCNGRVLMENRRIEGEETVYEEATKQAQDFVERGN